MAINMKLVIMASMYILVISSESRCNRTFLSCVALYSHANACMVFLCASTHCALACSSLWLLQKHTTRDGTRTHLRAVPDPTSVGVTDIGFTHKLSTCHCSFCLPSTAYIYKGHSLCWSFMQPVQVRYCAKGMLIMEASPYGNFKQMQSRWVSDR